MENLRFSFGVTHSNSNKPDPSEKIFFSSREGNKVNENGDRLSPFKIHLFFSVWNNNSINIMTWDIESSAWERWNLWNPLCNIKVGPYLWTTRQIFSVSSFLNSDCAMGKKETNSITNFSTLLLFTKELTNPKARRRILISPSLHKRTKKKWKKKYWYWTQSHFNKFQLEFFKSKSHYNYRNNFISISTKKYCFDVLDWHLHIVD